MKAVREPGCGEGGSDLLHLSDPAPPLDLRRAGGALEPVGQLGERQAPLLDKRLLYAFGACEVASAEPFDTYDGCGGFGNRVVMDGSNMLGRAVQYVNLASCVVIHASR